MFLVLASVTWMAACGNSNGGGSSIISVTASCSPSTIQFGESSQCSATITGTGNFSSAISWSASAGSISTSGLFTAPAAGNASLLVTITATSRQDTSKFGTTAVTVNPVGQTGNLQPIVVDVGPEPQTFSAVNEPFTTVTVCVPNSSSCQTIDHVLVDTGSSGLRVLSSVLTIALPQETDSGSNPFDECNVFLDGYTWGPVSNADILLSGETALSAHVQVMIPSSASPAVPSSCSSQTTGGDEGDSVSALGANGILGVGLFQQDCGQFCVTNSTNPTVYYICPPSGCTPTTAQLAQQVANPVTLFAADDNGVLIQLPAVPNGGSSTVTGSLIFGIGTQANNGLGSATVYTVPDSGSNAGNITTTFNNTSYPSSFIDSGSNGIFFLDTATTGIPTCASPNDSWYCPTISPDNLSATNQGLNGNQGTVNFTLEDASTLFQGSNSAFSTLGGPNPDSFDWGLAFFFGRNVFTAIENSSTPGGPGPYVAY
jgi:Protein of unknown function (DUF3443)